MTNLPKILDVRVSSDISRWENEGGAILPGTHIPSGGINSMRITIIAAMVLASVGVYALSFV
jgi:hypothetical protein